MRGMVKSDEVVVSRARLERLEGIAKDARELLGIFVNNYVEEEDVPLANRLHDSLNDVGVPI